MLFQPFSAEWRIAENEKQHTRNTYKYKCQVYSHNLYSFVLLDNLKPTNRVENTIDTPNTYRLSLLVISSNSEAMMTPVSTYFATSIRKFASFSCLWLTFFVSFLFGSNPLLS